MVMIQVTPHRFVTSEDTGRGWRVAHKVTRSSEKGEPTLKWTPPPRPGLGESSRLVGALCTNSCYSCLTSSEKAQTILRTQESVLEGKMRPCKRARTAISSLREERVQLYSTDSLLERAACNRTQECTPNGHNCNSTRLSSTSPPVTVGQLWAGAPVPLSLQCRSAHTPATRVPVAPERRCSTLGARAQVLTTDTLVRASQSLYGHSSFSSLRYIIYWCSLFPGLFRGSL